MPYLRYINEGGHLVTQSLGVDPVIVGRAPNSQIVLDSDMVSREHARIELADEGRYRTRDLGSRNKTYVCGQLITETLLSGGDIIRIGDRVIEYIDENAERVRIGLDFLTPDRREPPDCEWVKIKAPLSLTHGQLEALSRLPGQVSMTSRPEDMGEAALAHTLLEVKAERGFIAMRGDGKRDLRIIAQRGLKPPPTGSLTPVSESFVYSAILQSVAGRYPQSAGGIDAKAGYSAAGMVAPLTYRGDILGLIYVDRPITKHPFPPAALQLFAATGAQIGATMAESSRRIAEAASREGAAWMTTIRRLQGSLQSTPESNDAFAIGIHSHPGRARCGDLVDVVQLDEQRCALIVVDAGGHGVHGLAQGAALRAAIRTAISLSEDVLMDPSPLFNALNAMTAANAGRRVIPCCLVGVDTAAGRAAYINAGAMPPLLMVAAGRLVTLDQPALVLGVDPDYVYEATRVDLPEEFRLLAYTDGLAEATNSAGEPLGHERLHEALLEPAAFTNVDELLAAVKNVWASHLAGVEPDDDATAAAVSRG